MPLAIQLIIMVVAGVVCAAIAASKGRNAVGWFFFGFFFALVAIVVVLVVSNLKEERARFEHAASERRRLREELKLERMRNQQFRGLAQQRLDVHDRALGVNTRHLAPPLAGAAPALQIGAPTSVASEAATAGAAPVAEAPAPSAVWHYATADGIQHGPVTYQELAAAWGAAVIDPESLVWRAGWKDWHRVADVPELHGRLGS